MEETLKDFPIAIQKSAYNWPVLYHVYHVLDLVPFEYLKLWFDLPWTVVLADFRQGLFLCAMATFWAVFVAEHRSYDNVNYWIFNSFLFVGIDRCLRQVAAEDWVVIGNNWQLCSLDVLLSSLMSSVRGTVTIELCILPLSWQQCRGIQVILPFYSLWSTREGQQLAVS